MKKSFITFSLIFLLLISSSAFAQYTPKLKDLTYKGYFVGSGDKSFKIKDMAGNEVTLKTVPVGGLIGANYLIDFDDVKKLPLCFLGYYVEWKENMKKEDWKNIDNLLNKFSPAMEEKDAKKIILFAKKLLKAEKNITNKLFLKIKVGDTTLKELTTQYFDKKFSNLAYKDSFSKILAVILLDPLFFYQVPFFNKDNKSYSLKDLYEQKKLKDFPLPARIAFENFAIGITYSSKTKLEYMHIIKSTKMLKNTIRAYFNTLLSVMFTNVKTFEEDFFYKKLTARVWYIQTDKVIVITPLKKVSIKIPSIKIADKKANGKNWDLGWGKYKKPDVFIIFECQVGNKWKKCLEFSVKKNVLSTNWGRKTKIMPTNLPVKVVVYDQDKGSGSDIIGQIKLKNIEEVYGKLKFGQVDNIEFDR